MLVLTWNIYHGRTTLKGSTLKTLKGSDPSRVGDHLDEFTEALAGWEWDVALLQEVPPWWPEPLAAATGAQQRTALTSRNAGLWLRRWIAERRPDLIKSNGGGANAILVRGAEIAEHRRRRLRWWPERRVLHAVRLGTGEWVGNLHAQVHSEKRGQRDVALAAETMRAWARGAPFVVGGDLNVREPRGAGVIHAGGHGVDHVLVSGLLPEGKARVLDRGHLSDHAPILVELQEGSAPLLRQEQT